MVSVEVGKVVLQLKRVGIQLIVGSEGLVAKGHVVASILQNVHQREHAVVVASASCTAASEVAVGGESHLELVAQLVAHARVELTNHREDVVVDYVVGTLKVERVVVAVPKAKGARIASKHVAVGL